MEVYVRKMLIGFCILAEGLEILFQLFEMLGRKVKNIEERGIDLNFHDTSVVEVEYLKFYSYLAKRIQKA